MTEQRKQHCQRTVNNILLCEDRGVYAAHPECQLADLDMLAAIVSGETYFDYQSQRWIEKGK